MNKALKIAVILGAVDNMSTTVKTAFGNLKSEYLKGGALMSAGIGIGQGLINFAEDYREFEEAAAKAKISIMGPGGIFDAEMYKRIQDYSVATANKYLGTTASYLQMVTVLKNNRITEEDILGGVGDASAQLAELFQIPAKESGLFAARIKNDMKVAVSDMPKMMDMLARMQGAGVGTTGQETVYELTEFFSKAGLGAANLGVTGANEAQKLGALGGLFVTKGISGQTAGTNFRRIFDGLRDVERVGKTQSVGRQYGVDLQFFKDGKFAGVENFVAQLSKLEGMDPQKISEIMKPFSGKQGLSIDFLEYLAKFGNTDYKEFLHRMDEQANLTEKVDVYLQTLTAHQLDAERSWQSGRAALAEAYNPALKKYYEYSSKAAEATARFAKQHPDIVKWSVAIIGGAAAIMALVGAFKILAASAAFLGVLPMLSSISFAVWALKYHIVTGLIPALSGMGAGWTAALGPIGLVLASMWAIKKLSDELDKYLMPVGITEQRNLQRANYEKMQNGTWLQSQMAKPNAVSGRSDSTSVVFSPNINIGGNANQTEVDTMNNKMFADLKRLIEQIENDKKRKGFS